MAYPLTAPITMDSEADKLTVMAVRIVICLRMETPPSISSGGDMKKWKSCGVPDTPQDVAPTLASQGKAKEKEAMKASMSFPIPTHKGE
jgi:hypothetical protein